MPPSNNTVPDVFGNVIVRSAVGSVTVKVVSNASAVAPSKVILEPLIVSEVAVILGISKALISHDENLKKNLKKDKLTTRDSRVVERKKYGHRKARRSFQFSKR